MKYANEKGKLFMFNSYFYFTLARDVLTQKKRWNPNVMAKKLHYKQNRPPRYHPVSISFNSGAMRTRKGTKCVRYTMKVTAPVKIKISVWVYVG